MSLYYCPACGQLYKADSAKYTAFCVRCGMPSPKKASPHQEIQHETLRRELEKLHK